MSPETTEKGDRFDVWVTAVTAPERDSAAGLQEVFGIDSQLALRLVESVPVVVKRNVNVIVANEYVQALETLGLQGRLVPQDHIPSTPPGTPPAQFPSLPPVHEQTPSPAPASGPEEEMEIERDVYSSSYFGHSIAPEVNGEPLDYDPNALELAIDPSTVSRASGSPARALADSDPAGQQKRVGAPRPVQSSRPADPSRPPSTLQRPAQTAVPKAAIVGAAVVVFSLIGAVVLAFVALGNSTQGAPEGLDARVAYERGEQRSVEARQWLQSPAHLLLNVPDPARALGYVNGLYTAGAVDVQVIHIDGLVQQIAATLDVELPTDPAEAKAVERLARDRLVSGPVPFAPGAEVERGERFLRIRFVTAQNPGELASEADLWQDVDELHRSKFQKSRGLE